MEPPAHPLRSLVPDSLLTRTFLLVSLLIVTSVAIWLTLFGLSEREPRARQISQLALSILNITNAALIAADPEKRLALLQDLAESEGIHLYPAEETDITEALPETYVFQRMQELLQTSFGDKTRFAGNVNGQAGLWISFSIGDSDEDDYWLRLPGEHAERDFPWHWLTWGGASLLLALLSAWLIVSRVTRPMRALALAAIKVGRGGNPEHIPEQGAIEIRHVAGAFNTMTGNLVAMNAERAEILAGISHDLRTPLSRLRLELELSMGDEEARSAAVADIEQMDGIIAQFLDYARDGTDRSRESCDLNAVVCEVATRITRSSSPPEFLLGDLPLVEINRQGLTRAISNLLENARKYAGEDLRIVTSRADGLVHIDIMDRGPGIPAEEVERLKRPFTRLETARSNVTGTGLGLAIVERVMRQHDGRLELHPREGGGLTARLVLPETEGC